MISDFITGARYLVRGFTYAKMPGIRIFAVIPLLINVLLFSIAIWFAVGQFADWLALMQPDWMPDWLMSAIGWIVWPLFVVVLLIVVFFSFSVFANFIAAPFNGLLAEKVQQHLAQTAQIDMSWWQLIKDTPSLMLNELHKLLYMVSCLLPILLLFLVPGINIVAPLLWLLFSAWLLALDYHDYPLGNQQLAFKQQRLLLGQHRAVVMGFGSATLLMTLIPVINFLVIPVAVCGATLLCHEQLGPQAVTDR